MIFVSVIGGIAFGFFLLLFCLFGCFLIWWKNNQEDSNEVTQRLWKYDSVVNIKVMKIAGPLKTVNILCLVKCLKYSLGLCLFLVDVIDVVNYLRRKYLWPFDDKYDKMFDNVHSFVSLTISTLDGVAMLLTDPPPTSFTTLSKKKRRTKYYVNIFGFFVCDMWHVTHEIWHMTCWGGEPFINISAP